jgi:hypothetical protein
MFIIRYHDRSTLKMLKSENHQRTLKKYQVQIGFLKGNKKIMIWTS